MHTNTFEIFAVSHAEGASYRRVCANSTMEANHDVNSYRCCNLIRLGIAISEQTISVAISKR